MRILVATASRHGSTEEIAAAIATSLRVQGHEVDLQPAAAVAGTAGYDAAVIGSAVYYGHWLDSARDLARDPLLADIPLWLFSSGPLGPQEHLHPQEDPIDVAALVEQTGAVLHRVFAGRLDPAKLGFRERAMVRAVKAQAGDFRDWEDIGAFATEIGEHLANTRVG